MSFARFNTAPSQLQRQPQKEKDALRCPDCQSTEIEYDAMKGERICSKCGEVVEENVIVSGQPDFMETAQGVSRQVGVRVSESGVARGFPMLGHTRDSHEVTIDSARKKMQQIASALQLGDNTVEAAVRVFSAALAQKFVQGRRTRMVSASCLYVACRLQNTPHMLIDFADHLKENVFDLGQYFLQLRMKCNLTNIPLIDPCLYIYRFASKLEFDDKCAAVAATAVQLVKTMKRDWIHRGRKPAGICGAALLISARLHGFRRSQKDIIKVVRICDGTLRKRLEEFESTPSSDLTITEFETIDPEDLESCNPPSFNRAREKDSTATSAIAHIFIPPPPVPSNYGNIVIPAPEELEREIDEILRGEMQELDSIGKRREMEQTRGILLPPVMVEAEELEKAIAEEEEVSSIALLNRKLETQLKEQQKILEKSEILDQQCGIIDSDRTVQIKTAIATTKSLLQKARKGIEEKMGSKDTKELEENQEEEEQDDLLETEDLLDDIPDEEIDVYLCTAKEAENKRKIWMAMHKDYLLKQAEKQKSEAQETGDKRRTKKRKRTGQVVASSAAESARRALEKTTRSKSTKINYDALKNLFGDEQEGEDQSEAHFDILASAGIAEEDLQDTGITLDTIEQGELEEAPEDAVPNEEPQENVVAPPANEPVEEEYDEDEEEEYSDEEAINMDYDEQEEFDYDDE